MMLSTSIAEFARATRPSSLQQKRLTRPRDSVINWRTPHACRKSTHESALIRISLAATWLISISSPGRETYPFLRMGELIPSAIRSALRTREKTCAQRKQRASFTARKFKNQSQNQCPGRFCCHKAEMEAVETILYSFAVSPFVFLFFTHN